MAELAFFCPDKDKLLVQIITLALEQLHFEPKDLNDEYSEDVYNTYLKQIDPDFHEDFHTSESTIRELVLSCRRRLSNLAGDSMNIANENINTIRFDLALLDYYLTSSNKK